MTDRTIEDIENEMRELYPKKELAYIDYRENTGDSETADRLFAEFRQYRDKWNALVEERKELLERR